MNKTFRILLFLLPIAIAGCRTPRVATELPDVYRNEEFVIRQVQENLADFEHMNIRLRMRFNDGGQNFSSNAALRIRKDSMIWISVMPMMGIEAARVLITPDSLTVIDRFQRTYSVTTFSELTQMAGVPFADFAFLQGLLTGNPMFPLHDQFALTVDGRDIRLSHQGAFEDVVYHILPEIFRPSHIDYNNLVVNQRASITYGGHQQVGEHYVPHTINFEVRAPNRVSLSLEINNYTVNEPQEFPFAIPDTYERRP